MSAIDKIKLTRVAFGIRFDDRFGLEDVLGDIVDEILSSDVYGPNRFQQILHGTGSRILMNNAGTETLNLTRADAIYENKTADALISEVPQMASDFVNIAWSSVGNHLRRKPSINRYGCIIGFELPRDWDPITALLNQESYETSELAMRYSKRLPTEKGLSTAGVNDYRNAILQLLFRNGRGNASIDYQQYFDPALESDKARKEDPYSRFIERAVAYFSGSGWELLHTRLQRLPQAA